MNREEYIEKLKYALEHIDDTEKVNGIIEEVCDYKPEGVMFRTVKCAERLRKPDMSSNLSDGLPGTFSTKIMYDGVEEAISLLKKIYALRNSSYNVAKLETLLNTLKGNFNYYERLLKLCDATKGFSFDLYKALYAADEIVAFDIYYLSFDKDYLESIGVTFFENCFKIANIGTLKEDIQKKQNAFLLLKNGINDPLVDVLNERLKACGKNTYIYDEELTCLSAYIDKECDTAAEVNIIASGYDWDSLVQINSRKYRKLVNCEYGASNHILSYGKYCDYVQYISDLYCENVDQLIHKKSEVVFSVLIPARNSELTLEHTLRTCLEQTYAGQYEIVVSDNSSTDNNRIYEICKKINDARVVYIKTPREFPLTKSFEYGYVHCKGEYILAIGSDDGLLPWALEKLDEVIKQYPEEYIIQWERGFYAWPSFNGGQQNQLIVPRKYDFSCCNKYHKDGIDYLAEVMVNPDNIYGLPMLYINSCFKRTYFDVLLDKTGSLWNGVCQDIYMGVVNAAINSKILNIEFPLTVAGMSSGSIGANANKGIQTCEKLKQHYKMNALENNVGAYCKYLYENYIAFTGSDTASLYISILRLIQQGVIDEIYITQVIPWQKWYTTLVNELDILDISYERKIFELKKSSRLLGQEFSEWFDKEVVEPRMNSLVKVTHTQIETFNSTNKKSYKVGKNSIGGITLDASEYKVKNIYDAVKLFEKLIRKGY